MDLIVATRNILPPERHAPFKIRQRLVLGDGQDYFIDYQHIGNSKKFVSFVVKSKPIYVVSPEDLLISKLIWIQEVQPSLQMEDIKNLTEIEDLDKDYVSRWINMLKLNTFNLLSL